MRFFTLFHQRKPSKKRLRRLYVLAVTIPLLLILIPVVYLSLNRASETSAAWFDGGYGYRKKIPITNTSGTAQTDFQVQLTQDTATLVTAGKLQSDCDDIRFTDLSGKVLSYWLEPGTCNSASTLIWVKVPSIPTSGADIYWYYGNPSASTASQADQTFVREMNAAAAAWTLDDTTSTQSYARAVHPADLEGRDVVINGGFDADSDWTKGTGWTIANGVAAIDGSQITTITLTQTNTSLIPGKTYELTYTISGTSGSNTFRLDFGSTTGTNRSTNGTFTETLIYTGSAGLVMRAGSGRAGSIDNIIVKQLNIPSSQTTATNLLSDGDMETAGTSAWTAGNSATLTKETTSPYGGTQTLRIARNGVTSPYAAQTILTIGQVYRVQGYVRTDGNTIATIFDGASTAIWTSSLTTSNTNWQTIDFLFKATSTEIRFRYNTATGTQYAEYDNLVVSLDTSVRTEEILRDGNMESIDTSNWTSVNGATLSKQTTSPHGGAQVIRVTATGSTSARASQSYLLVTGKRYRVTGWARSDGTAVGQINDSSSNWLTLTTSTSWQQIDVTAVAVNTTFNLQTTTGTNGVYMEFDDISLTEVSPLVGLPTNGVTLGSSSGTGGHGSTAYSFDGSNDFVNIYSSDLNSVFNPGEGTLVAWAKVSGSGVWSDGTYDYIAQLSDGTSNNKIMLRKDSTTNQVSAHYYAGGVTKGATSTVLNGTTGWFQIIATWNKSGDQMKLYVNGSQAGSTQTGLGTWSGNLVNGNTVIGADNTSGNTPWSGLINDVRLYTRALSDTEIIAQYSASVDISPYTTSNYPGKELFRKNDNRVTTGALASEETTPGPIAELKFDEGQGTTTQDSTLNNNDGSISGATWITEDQCISEKCLRFDGADDYVQVTQSPTTNIVGKSGFTASVWINPTSAGESNAGRILDKTDSVSNQTMGYNLRLGAGSGNYLAVGAEYDNGVEFTTSTNPVTINTWNHVVMVYNQAGDGKVRIYVNGKFIDQSSGTDLTIQNDAAYNLRIGQTLQDTTRSFAGKIDEVKIYNYSRSSAQIKADYNTGASKLGSTNQAYLSNGLVGYWKMDETSGTTVADSSGNGNTGTLTNAQETGTADASGGSTTVLVDTDGTLSSTDDAYNGMILRVTSTCGAIAANTDRLISDYTGSTKTFTVSSAFAATLNSCAYQILHQTGGKYGNAIEFSGNTDYVALDTAANLELTANPMTVSLWVNPNRSIENNDAVFAIASGATRYMIYRSAATALQVRFTDSSSTNVVSSSATTPLNTWTHLVIVVPAGIDTPALFYANGQLVSSSLPTAGTSWFYNSAETFSLSNTNSFPGKVDEARLYNRALSPVEVTDLYSFAPGPVAHWKMDEGSGTSAVDSTGNGYTGTITGTTYATAVNGKGLQFDNDSDYVTIGDVLDFGAADNFTLSGWFRRDSDTTHDFMFNTFGTFGYRLYVTSNDQVYFNLSDGTDSIGLLSGTTFVKSSQWIHVAAVLDRSSESKTVLYINGVKMDDATGDGLSSLDSLSSNATLRLGYGTIASDSFHGGLDDLRIYNYARSQEQILLDMRGDTPPDVSGQKLPDPVAYYSLDEQQGQTANNKGVGGSTLNGTFGADSSASTDDPTWKTKTDCKINGCASFDGGDFVDLGDLTATEAVSQLTVSTWVYDTAFSNLTCFVCKFNHANTQTSWNIQSYATNAALTAVSTTSSDGNTYAYTANNALTSSAWNHIVMVFDGTQTGNSNRLKIYINGILRSLTFVGTIPASTIATTSNARIGATNDGARYLSGTIDETRIYTTALTQDQIAQDYAGGLATGYGVTASSEATLISDGAGNPPVAYWNMDEKTGTSANDFSGNGYTGTLTSGPTWTRGKIGTGIKLDGTDDYVAVADQSSFTPTSSGFTVQGWVKYDAFETSGSQTRGPLISKTPYAGGANGWEWSLGTFAASSTTTPTFWFITTDTSGGTLSLAQSTSTAVAGTWYYLVGTVDASGVARLYINGVLSATGSSAAFPSNTSTPLTIGAEYGAANRWDINGIVDEIKIYNYARTQAQIAYDYNRGGPIGHWKMDECEGTSVNDASGNGSSGTITIGASGEDTVGTCNTSSTAWGSGATGRYNSSLNLDGTDDHVTVTDTNNLYHLISDLSFGAWVKTTGASSTDIILSKGTTSDWLYAVFMTAGQIYCKTYTAGSGSAYVQAVSTQTVNDGNWHHIFCTFSGTTMTTYIDGKVAATSSAVTGTRDVSSAGSLYIGSFYNSSSSLFWEGQIDDVQIYNYALSANKVKQLYNGGFSTFYGPNTGQP